MASSLFGIFNLENYKEVFSNGIVRYFLNSIFVCAVSLVIALFISSLAAYPIARMRSKVGKWFLLLVLACMVYTGTYYTDPYF